MSTGIVIILGWLVLYGLTCLPCFRRSAGELPRDPVGEAHADRASPADRSSAPAEDVQ